MAPTAAPPSTFCLSERPVDGASTFSGGEIETTVPLTAYDTPSTLMDVGRRPIMLVWAESVALRSVTSRTTGVPGGIAAPPVPATAFESFAVILSPTLFVAVQTF